MGGKQNGGKGKGRRKRTEGVSHRNEKKGKKDDGEGKKRKANKPKEEMYRAIRKKKWKNTGNGREDKGNAKWQAEESVQKRGAPKEIIKVGKK